MCECRYPKCALRLAKPKYLQDHSEQCNGNDKMRQNRKNDYHARSSADENLGINSKDLDQLSLGKVVV
jgi:hypothetical protein